MKKTNYIYCLLSVLILFITACGAGVGDSSEDLSGGYVYRVDGSLRFIVPNHIFKERIYPNVTNYAYNDEYIIVAQQPL